MVGLGEGNVDAGMKRDIWRTKFLSQRKRCLNGGRFTIILFKNTTLNMKVWNALLGKEPSEAKNDLKQRECKVFREKGK